jgi:hypothetical protein
MVTLTAVLDQFLAVEKGLGKSTHITSLEVAVATDSAVTGETLSYDASGTPLPKIIDPVQAFDRWNQMRRYFFSNVLAVRAPQAQREHHAIVDAMRARAADRLSALLSEHNRHALDDYLHHLDSRPADAAGGSASPRTV